MAENKSRRVIFLVGQVHPDIVVAIVSLAVNGQIPNIGEIDGVSDGDGSRAGDENVEHGRTGASSETLSDEPHISDKSIEVIGKAEEVAGKRLVLEQVVEFGMPLRIGVVEDVQMSI